MSSRIKLGLTVETLLALDRMPVPVIDPGKYKFHEGMKLRGANSGKKLWSGLPWVEMQWSLIEQLMRDQLRAYCPGASAEVVVQLPVNDALSQLVEFYGTLVWQEDEEPAEYGKIPNLKLKIINLTPVGA